MRLVRDDEGALAAIELADAEMRELVALEATRAILSGGPREGGRARERRLAFLSATQRYYGLSGEAMAPFTGAERPTAGEVLELQILKRASRGQAAAVEILQRFRALESALGEGILKIYVDRCRRYAVPRAEG